MFWSESGLTLGGKHSVFITGYTPDMRVTLRPLPYEVTAAALDKRTSSDEKTLVSTTLFSE